MVMSVVRGVGVAGLAVAVPAQARTVADDEQVFGVERARRVSESVGVSTRRVAPPGVCTSDLCQRAADSLLDNLGWGRDTIDALVLVTQTPDYLLPATSCVLHAKLGLADHCAVLDVNLGCSGYVYGLWLLARLLDGVGLRRGLLLAGDTISRIVSPFDSTTALLFGDAGSATALEWDDSSQMLFDLHTDGTGYRHLMVPAGGCRQPHSEQTARREMQQDGNIRSEEDLFMNGAEIFSFSLRAVPPSINAVLSLVGWSVEQVDAFVLHQANQFILQHLRKRMRLDEQKVVIALEEYGNTSSASIPLAIAHALRTRLTHSSLNLVLVGFGVGLSWASAALRCGPIVVPGVIHVYGA
jgi:3-oxoacyl-[acyl-carrier-protein] synthase-3